MRKKQRRNGVIMLQNNNLKICRRLVWRDIKFHKGRSIFLVTAVALVCMLYTFSFSLGGMIRDGYLYTYRMMYGSNSHILFFDMSKAQARTLCKLSGIREAVTLSAVGTLSDDMMEYRSVKLAAVSEGWAKATESVPFVGRMPEQKWEIALDELTMNSLAIPHEIGTEVVLRWKPADGGAERTDRFRLCGWWESLMGQTETCAWITEETAQALCPDAPARIALGVTLYRPGNLEEQAQDMLDRVGLQTVSYTTNLAYNETKREFADSAAMGFYQMNLIVVLCGVLMIYNIVRISAGQNIRFYGRVKSLGMSPRQIRVLAMEQAAFYFVSAVVPGWGLGILLHVAVAPYVVIGMEQNPAIRFFRLWPLAAGALFTWLTTLAACVLPLRRVRMCSPASAMRFVEGRPGKKDYRGRRRRTTVWRMAVSGLTRQKGQSLLTVFSLLLSLCILCGIWTQQASYDEDKYVDGLSLSDYRLEDASATSTLQRYNPASRSITAQLLQALTEHPAVTDLGTVSSVEVPLYADEAMRAPIVDSFEKEDENGVPGKAVMAGNPDWMAGYEKLRESGEYIGVVMGVEGLMLDNAMAQGIIMEGTFVPEKFATGDYVLAAGANSPDIRTTPPVGSKVELGGREFEIMAALPYESTMVSGADSRQAQFNVTYYMPMETFDTLFPGHGIRNVAVDIDREQQAAFEAFLEQLLEGTGVTVTSFTTYQWNFHNAVFHQYMIPFFVGSVMLVIGILNFCNALVSRMLVRRKEFAVYESLGMTGRQLRNMLLWEGLLYYGIMSLILVSVTSAVTWIWGRWWLANANTWCITWRFSLLPLWLVLPVLFAAAVAVPLCCLKMLRQESVTLRLRVVD